MENLFSAVQTVELAAIFFTAGFVSGLSGFAFSAVAAVALWLIPPVQGIGLTLCLSLCNQLAMVGSLRRIFRAKNDEHRESAVPMIVGGLCGAPLGLALLVGARTALLTAMLGALLVLYSSYNLLRQAGWRIPWGGLFVSLVVGALGGFVGGFSAFPGSVPVVYLSLRGLTKDQTRSVLQPYIIVLQFFALLLLCMKRPGTFDTLFLRNFVLCLPTTLAGTSLGLNAYRRLSDVAFRRALLLLLGTSGISLLAKALLT